MTHNFIEEIELPNRIVKVPVEVEWSEQNDGIGGYEFWGQKCFDYGNTYIEIESWGWDKEGYSDEEVGIIEGFLDDKALDEWPESISKSCQDNKEYAAEEYFCREEE